MVVGELEQFKVFTKQREYVGIASREEVHQKGYWHETFHFWLVAEIEGENYLYFQLRSEDKKDYPGLLDITAAGHLLHNENIEDGIREVKEEIGLTVAIEELNYLGVFPYEKVLEDFIDKEHAHVFLLKRVIPLQEFTLQQEEVSGMYLVPIDGFMDLWFKDYQDTILIEGLFENKEGKMEASKWKINKANFVPHSDDFYRDVLNAIINKIS
ncbi:NUDIX domain-containing protein [Bacillus sp. RO2]|uniref:NUDIX hydrolase n=1 Tax=Bacillus sp. RO2 TaxID=2723913 RepID=UPI0032173136